MWRRCWRFLTRFVTLNFTISSVYCVLKSLRQLLRMKTSLTSTAGIIGWVEDRDQGPVELMPSLKLYAIWLMHWCPSLFRGNHKDVSSPPHVSTWNLPAESFQRLLPRALWSHWQRSPHLQRISRIVNVAMLMGIQARLSDNGVFPVVDNAL